MVSIARLTTALAAAALAATVSACAAQAPAGGSGSSPSTGSNPSATPAPDIVVHLASRFTPDRVRLAVGQSFVLIVSSGIQAAVPAGGALLTERPVAEDRYRYTARVPGTTTLTTTVKPKCPPGTVCPQWIAVARLTVTVH